MYWKCLKKTSELWHSILLPLTLNCSWSKR